MGDTNVPTFSSPSTSGANTLGEVARFIQSHAGNSFDRMFSATLAEISTEHEPWAGFCPAGHTYDDVPCDTYEDNLALGISCLMCRIEDVGDGSA